MTFRELHLARNGAPAPRISPRNAKNQTRNRGFASASNDSLIFVSCAAKIITRKANSLHRCGKAWLLFGSRQGCHFHLKRPSARMLYD